MNGPEEQTHATHWLRPSFWVEAGKQRAMHWLVGRYYRSAYLPQLLGEADLAPAPAGFRLTDVPRTTSDLPKCQSVSLKMVAAQAAARAGQAAPALEFADFLMAFTYGFSSIPGRAEFFPGGTDPEVGLRAAAPYLGLALAYRTTDVADLLLRAMRATLAHGAPVRLPLDMATLYDAPGTIPHSVVVVGYDADGFEFYETVGLPPSPTQPGQAEPGAPGQHASSETVVRAVTRLRQTFSWPWRYALVTFTAGPTATDLRPVWKMIAAATLGGNKYGPPVGAPVLDKLAETLETDRAPVAPAVADAIATAHRFRADNARFLCDHFAGNPTIQRASEAQASAAAAYAALAPLLSNADHPDARAQAAALVRKAAEQERIFGSLARGLAGAAPATARY